ncbi:transglutaminaseTgpA domain-containing protein [Fodinicola acaciae]|uniref:transglutaminase family protein n=1 Tax=Fodinicola acaciae TaxID=2681555 RepID=UPI0013D2B998|nr:DUF3488 and transglutaminase-like domain-containing protein [Fodinicola acaciae]
MPGMSALSWQLRRTVVVAVAVMLSALALGPIFASLWGWLLPVLGAVAVVAAFAALSRSIRIPVWLQPVFVLVGLLLYALIALVRDGNWFGVIPTLESLKMLAYHASNGVSDIVAQTTPAQTTAGLVLLTAIGVGVVAMVADVAAVTMRKPALAGLPMLALYAIPVSVTGSGLPWPLFVIGAAGYLWLISTDHRDRIRGWGRMMRPARQSSLDGRSDEVSSTPIGAAGRRIGLIGIAVAVLIPLVLPTLPGANLPALLGGAGWNGPGTTNATLINPIADLKGRLNQTNNNELLKVTTTENQPHQSLRLTTLDVFSDRTGWQSSKRTVNASSRVNSDMPVRDLGPDLPKHTVTSTVQIVDLTDSPYLPIYPNPRSIDVDGDWRYDAEAGSVVNPSGGHTGDDRDYKLTNIVPDVLSSDSIADVKAALRNAPELPSTSPVMRAYTGHVKPIPMVQQIVNQTIKGKKTWYDKAYALQKYFGPENGFKYSTQTKDGNSGDDLVNFLNNKEGFCVQYAAAMAYMARLAGLPSRVAIGFTIGTSLGQHTYSIRAHDAHAWVEVYFSGVGWVTFDPTPPDANTNRLALPWTQPDPDNSPTGGTTPDAQPTPSASAAGPANSQGHALEDPYDQDGAGGSLDTGPPAYVWWLLGVAVAILLVMLLPAVVRARTRRRRMARARGGTPVEAAHAGWDEILDTATDLQYPLDVTETPRGTAERLSSEAGFDDAGVAAIDLLASAEERARYAAAADAPAGVDTAAATVGRQLRRAVSKRRRWRATLLPSSAIARMSERSSRWSEAMAERVWRIRRAFGHVLPGRG